MVRSSNNLFRLGLILGGLMLATTAHGQNAPHEEVIATDDLGMTVKPHVLGHSIGKLGLLYEQRLILKAQAELVNAQSQFKTQNVTTAKIAESYAPTVKMVQGVGNNIYATFLYPENMTMDAKVGDVISGGFTVEAISVSQVILSKDGERLRLGFSASPPTPFPALDRVSQQPLGY